MESYLVEVIDEDHESSVVMNFADSIQELIDNIVCMEQFVFITKIKRVSDNKEIKLTKDVIDLEDLRMYRVLIDDEVSLRQTLTNKEDNSIIQ
jgi:hypothetical protein|tara:strand:- start:58 stop:336 length:279 start_codon:yes stop_codon:yes gene_type:complete